MDITPLDAWIHQKVADNQPVLSRAAIETWQLRKLNETLALVQAHSSFYRQRLGREPVTITSLEEITQLPFTTGADISRQPAHFVCVPQGEIARVVTLESSGTTGEPKRLFFTAGDQDLTIDFFGVGMSTLTRPGDTVLILLPCERPGSVGDLLRISLERTGRLPIPHGPVRDPSSVLGIINSQSVGSLVATPTQALGLARRWQPGMQRPHSALLSTDHVPLAIVHALQSAWGAEVFNHYGSTEMGLGGGVECGAHRGCHLREADLYFEIVDPRSGSPVLAGETGEVVFTTLTRRGMPLIRYRTGDQGRLLPGLCPCGSLLKPLCRVRSRYAGLIPVADTILCLADLDEALFPIPGLLDFSVTLTGGDARPALVIEAKTLSSVNLEEQVVQAARSIPAASNLDIEIRCHQDLAWPGSIRKRVILDQRSLAAKG